jgi:GrpB-like predicted nucleotidyltransferase (UPF0157 family)
MPQPIIIIDYDPTWPAIFEQLRQVYALHLGEFVQAIEHVGSTSVPGLAAKPVLDIDLVLRHPDDLAGVILRLSLLGYTHEGDQGIPGREAFKRQDEGVPWDGSGRSWMQHHLYAVAADSRELERHLAFRRALCGNPNLATGYAELKRDLALRYRDDREVYTQGKSEFIEAVLRQEQESRS